MFLKDWLLILLSPHSMSKTTLICLSAPWKLDFWRVRLICNLGLKVSTPPQFSRAKCATHMYVCCICDLIVLRTLDYRHCYSFVSLLGALLQPREARGPALGQHVQRAGSRCVLVGSHEWSEMHSVLHRGRVPPVSPSFRITPSKKSIGYLF